MQRSTHRTCSSRLSPYSIIIIPLAIFPRLHFSSPRELYFHFDLNMRGMGGRDLAGLFYRNINLIYESSTLTI